MYPEIYPSIPTIDVTKLGVPITKNNLTPNDEVFFTTPLLEGVAKSFFVRVTMRSLDNLHFAQFAIETVVMNIGGVVSQKYENDSVTNRDNPDNRFFFQVVGTNLNIICKSNLPVETKWAGTVAIIDS